VSKIALRVGLLTLLIAPLLTVSADTKSFTGAVSSNWSNANNWSPVGVPAVTDTVNLPQKGNTVNFDLPDGTAVGPIVSLIDPSIIFPALPSLQGNTMLVTGDVTAALHCSLAMKLGASVKIAAASGDFANIDVNGQSLTIDGNGLISASLSGSGNVSLIQMGVQIDGGAFTGTITGDADVSGYTPNADLLAASFPWHSSVSGDGMLRDVDVIALSPGIRGPGSTWNLGSDEHSYGTLQVRNISVSTYSYFDLAPWGYDAVIASGSVNLAGTLYVFLPEIQVPSPGQHFMIIKNDGKGPINGTWDGYPEGSIVWAGRFITSTVKYPFRLTYAGGDGNDVELIAVADSASSSTQNAPTSVIGEPVTITATVNSTSGVPGGDVTFTDNGSAIGTVSLVNGVAALTVSTLGIGSHSIVAAYAGFGGYFGSAASPITHTVAQGQTTTSVDANDALLYGASQFRIAASPKAPAAGVVAGMVTLKEGAAVLGNGTLSSGSVIVNASSLKPGVHTLTASYGGSLTFLGSESDQTVFTIEPAPAKIDTWTDAPPALDGSLALKVSIFALTDVPDVPGGTVTVSENGVILAQQAVNGPISIPLKLSSGHHVLTVGYSGDDNFRPGAATFDEDVTAESPSRRRAVRH
jgi:hypothetical protein